MAANSQAGAKQHHTQDECWEVGNNPCWQRKEIHQLKHLECCCKGILQEGADQANCLVAIMSKISLGFGLTISDEVREEEVMMDKGKG